MIKAIIQTSKDTTHELEFPCHWRELNQWLTSQTRGEFVGRFRLSDEGVHLESDSEIGRHLIKLMDKQAYLEDLNDLATVVTNAREELHEELEQSIIHDQYSSADELYEEIHQITKDLAIVEETYYFPLTGSVYEGCDESEDVENDFLLEYDSKIREKFQKYSHQDIHNMAEYYDMEGSNKLLCADWDFSVKKGVLYGKVDIYLKEPMTEAETESLRDWIIGQNSDGLGEGFEQQDIPTDEGNLNVSFRHSGKDYFLYNQEEMDSYLQQKSNMKFGGI